MQWLVRSQDGKLLIPFDSVECVTVSGKHIVRNGGRVLGEYASEERCIEVLDEIQQSISRVRFVCLHGMTKEEFNELNGSIYKDGVVCVPNGVQIQNIETDTIIYQMPKE